jgi:hypothetical protein
VFDQDDPALPFDRGEDKACRERPDLVDPGRRIDAEQGEVSMIPGGDESTASAPSAGSGQRPLGAQEERHRIASECADTDASRAEDEEGVRRALIEEGAQQRDRRIMAAGQELIVSVHPTTVGDNRRTASAPVR